MWTIFRCEWRPTQLLCPQKKAFRSDRFRAGHGVTSTGGARGLGNIEIGTKQHYFNTIFVLILNKGKTIRNSNRVVRQSSPTLPRFLPPRQFEKSCIQTVSELSNASLTPKSFWVCLWARTQSLIESVSESVCDRYLSVCQRVLQFANDTPIRTLNTETDSRIKNKNKKTIDSIVKEIKFNARMATNRYSRCTFYGRSQPWVTNALIVGYFCAKY